MKCRDNCAACCIATSIQQAIPNMPFGKKAGEACANLDSLSLRCTIWGTPSYPSFCRDFSPEIEFCGNNREEAIRILSDIEHLTLPTDTPI